MNDNIYDQKIWVEKFIDKEAPGARDEERVNKILDAIPTDVTTLLDVGVGGAYVYRRLKGRKSLKCFGIDISTMLVKDLKDSSVCVGDVKNIPFKDDMFDLVLAADLLEHIKEEDFIQSVSELARVSKKYILINSPYKDAIHWPQKRHSIPRRVRASESLPTS